MADQDTGWVTVREICEEIGFHPNTVRGWIRAGKLPATDFGGSAGFKVRRADLDRFVAERRVRARAHEVAEQLLG